MSEIGDIDKQQLHDQAVAATEQAQELVRRSAELAGQIAEIELDVARVQDSIAENEGTAIGDQARNGQHVPDASLPRSSSRQKTADLSLIASTVYPVESTGIDDRCPATSRRRNRPPAGRSATTRTDQ
jgi:hypothetical protein